MRARSNEDKTDEAIAASADVAATEEIDLSLLEHSLAKTPWERMQANDDALRLANSLREAMARRNAKS
jgi:hypothetical protein